MSWFIKTREPIDNKKNKVSKYYTDITKLKTEYDYRHLTEASLIENCKEVLSTRESDTKINYLAVASSKI